MLSQKARYALRSLFLLAKLPAGSSMTIAEIADNARLPRKFLEQILLDLRKRGMLHSVRGKFGGYALGRPPDKISFADVIRAIDGPLALSPCVSVTAYRRCDDCVDEATCNLRKVLLQVRDSTAHILETRTLADDLEPAAPPKKTRRASAMAG